MKRLLLTIAAAIPVLLAGAVAAAQGHEAATATAAAPAKVTICHKTGSDTNPWRRTTVSSRALANPRSRSGRLLRAHLRHVGDAIVVGTAACPSATVTPQPSSTPATRITICHKTGSSSNPYRRITISSRAVTHPSSPAAQVLRGHGRHAGDLMLPGTMACPSGSPNQGAKLDANLQPVTGATGSGNATFMVRLGPSLLCYTLTVNGLTNITAAHIHRGSTQAVVVPLETPTTGSSSGCTSVERGLLREILQSPGAFYVNVHTVTSPNGQVQGRLTR